MTGKLIYLMGPAGVGKNSLLRAVHERLESAGCRVARRVITRSREAVSEDAVEVSPTEFEQLHAKGAFALAWRTNGLGYGIPREVNDWLQSGQSVLVNGSREYLPKALTLYPDLQPVLVCADIGVLSRRLLARGRESLGEIEARLARNSNFRSAEPANTLILDNSGPLEQTADAFVELVVGIIHPRLQRKSAH